MAWARCVHKWGFVFCLVLSGTPSGFAEEIPLVNQGFAHTYLTWMQQDTAHTMTVNFFTSYSIPEVVVYYDTLSHEDGSSYAWQQSVPTHLIHERLDLKVGWVALDSLKAATVYYFRVGHPSIGFTQERRFKTLPDDSRSLTVVVGGDMGTDPEVKELMQAAAMQDPDAALIGGDIAYANGLLSNWDKWERWLDYWESTMVTSQGNMIPMIVAIGNHEVSILPRTAENKAPFYLNLFGQQPRVSFFSRRLGAHAGVVVLDSDHLVSHEEQTPWLAQQLSDWQDLPYRMALYHVPLYPSHRSPNNSDSRKGRSVWGPLFDYYRLSLGLEHHDHSLKRTFPLKDGALNPQGTVYIGDGCWGKEARSSEDRWYLDAHGPWPHFWLLRWDQQMLEMAAIDSLGRVLDYSQLSPLFSLNLR